MKIFSKLSVLSIALLSSVQVFSCGYFTDCNEERMTNFDHNFLDFETLYSFVYECDYLHGDVSMEQYSFEQNIEQWYGYCNSKNVLKQDIYKALYKPSTINLETNTFIKHLKLYKPEAYQYYRYIMGLDVERSTVVESKKIFNRVWDDYAKEENEDYYREDYSVNSTYLKLDQVLKHIQESKDLFVKKRYAYQGVVSAFYYNDKVILDSLFETFFDVKNKTWLENSAQHYHALYSKDEKDVLLLDCIANGYDKLTRNIELITYSEGFNDAFAKTLDNEQLSYYYFVKTVRNAGRGLDNLKKIYELNPQNQYFDFLVNREINKIENWLLSNPNVNGSNYYDNYGTALMSVGYKNYQKDKMYAQEFLSFLKTVKPNAKSSMFYDVGIAYTEFLLGVKNKSFNPEKYRKNKVNYVQARVVDLFLNFDEKIKDASYQKYILFVLENASLLNENNKDRTYDWLWESKQNYMHDQLARGIGLHMLKYPQKRGEALLLTGKSTYADLSNLWGYTGNFYVNLFAIATKNDCKQVMELLRYKGKSSYYKFLQVEEKEHEAVHYSWSYDKCIDFGKGYDTLKILDIWAMKHVQADELNQALKLYKTFPKVYWNKYYNDNPFILYGTDGHNHAGKDIVAFNKMEFLEQFIAYKKQLLKKPTDSMLNFYVANAYYALTENGKFWYMSQNYSSLEYTSKDLSEKEDVANYFGCKRAIPYYENVVKYSKSKELKTMALHTLHTINKLNKELLTKENKELLDDVVLNCDLYDQYFASFNKKYKASIKLKSKPVVLLGFANYDDVNKYAWY